MPDEGLIIELSIAELREIARYAVMCALSALDLFERECPGDKRPRTAIEAAQAFADGAPRSKALRDAGACGADLALRARHDLGARIVLPGRPM